jgi:Lon protease-like protein
MPEPIELPLFPLHTVLCPGVALPLHIFEDRYRTLVERCIERDEPFGVVLIRNGRDTGPLNGEIAAVGTTALIRQAGRYPDGRFDIVTIGGSRFRIDEVDREREPYLVGQVELLPEPIGEPIAARGLATRVSERFLRYLELVQPDDEEDGPEIEVELVMEAGEVASDEPEPDDEPIVPAESLQLVESSSQPIDDRQRHEMLMAAAKRLVTPDDPTALSYVLCGLVQVELGRRQTLLEAPDTAERLRRLDALLAREVDLLERRLKPLVVDARGFGLRRN